LTGETTINKKKYAIALCAMLGLLSLFRIYHIVAGPFELTGDEAHYWEWSRHLDWSYYSKGPMIAWLIYAGTHFFGNNEFGVRVFAVVLSALSSVILFRLGREMYDDRTGFWAATLVQIVPLYSVFGIFFSIDSPYMFFWILSLYLFWRAYWSETRPDHRRETTAWWLLLGFSTGFGLLSKYTMALFHLSALLFMIFDGKARNLLKTRGPYLAVLVSLAVFSPVIFWNAAHGWVTMKHTAGQARIAGGLSFSPLAILDYLGSQLGAVTPVLCVLILLALWKMKKEDKGSFLFWLSMPTLIFFGLKSIQGRVQGNWALAGYAAGFIAVSEYYLKNIAAMTGHKKRLVISAPLVAFLVTALAYFPLSIPLPPDKHPARKMIGARAFGTALSEVHREMAAKGPVFIMSRNYQQSSLLSFYMAGNPVTYCLPLNRRMNQYDLWPGFQDLIGYNAIFTGWEDKLPPGVITKHLEAAFARCEKQEIAVSTRLGIMKYDVLRCYDFRGMAPWHFESY
jgi:undecaprenyl-diphosphatase